MFMHLRLNELKAERLPYVVVARIHGILQHLNARLGNVGIYHLFDGAQAVKADS